MSTTVSELNWAVRHGCPFRPSCTSLTVEPFAGAGVDNPFVYTSAAAELPELCADKGSEMSDADAYGDIVENDL